MLFLISIGSHLIMIILIPNDSFHPSTQNLIAFQSVINRLVTTPLPIENYNGEVKKIKKIANFNGYTTKMIDSTIRNKKSK